MKKSRKDNTMGLSIKVRTALALFTLVTIQGVILLCCIGFTGAIHKNDIAAYNILSKRSSGRASELGDMLNTKRKNAVNAAAGISVGIELTLNARSASVESLASDGALHGDVLNFVADDLIEFTKYNQVTGVFVVLDPTPDVADESKTSRTCVYLRDSSPGIIGGNNSNLLLEYGFVDIARRRGIAVNSLWTRDMRFDTGYSRDFYFKPLNAALSDPANERYDLKSYGYWSPTFLLRKDGLSVISYSVPLILSDGTVCGVMGFELDATHVSSLIKLTGMPYERGFYLLGTDTGSGVYNDSVVFSGAYANQFLSGPRAALDNDPVYESETGLVSEITNPNFPGRKAIGAYTKINLYETYSPFYGEEWFLACIAPKDSVLSGSASIRNAMWISVAGTIVLALLFSLFLTVYISDPIHMLSRNIRDIDPEKPVRFEKTGIREIDELSDAFEVLSDGVSEAAARMFKIVEFVDMPLGSFEADNSKKTIRLSKPLFGLLGFARPDDGSLVIPLSVWDEFIRSLEPDFFVKGDDGIVETLYVTGGEWDSKRWFRVRQVTENNRDIGVLIDVTDEIRQKQRLEFERNYDPLTKLFNRQAFLTNAFELINRLEGKVGVMMFADLDDLKFINDMYGHDTGDDYIRGFAGFLLKFNEYGAVSARMSGDEFVMFMGGFSSKEEARSAFDSVIDGLRDVSITTFDGTPRRIRVSIGLSYYPHDSADINELVKYADYAMYEIKHSNKGEVMDFNIGDYNKNSFVIGMKEMLNLLIEERRVTYAFQPIIDAATGEIFGYEALMRPMMMEFKSPSDVLKIARSQSKLYQIEKMTFYSIFEWAKNNLEDLRGKMIFVNSIPGQIFSDSDIKDMRNNFGYLADQIVFEITENEFSSRDDTKKKVDYFRDFGSMIAVDDYGSGYSNELALLSIEPDFLKIDMSIVRDIDKDTAKQQLVQNTIAYASRKNIRVIAEGIETYEELCILIDFGVDYIQGYYTAKPSAQISDIPEDVKARFIKAARRNNRSPNKRSPETDG